VFLRRPRSRGSGAEQDNEFGVVVEVMIRDQGGEGSRPPTAWRGQGLQDALSKQPRARLLSEAFGCLFNDDSPRAVVSAADQRGFCERQERQIVGQEAGLYFPRPFTLELKPPASNAA